MKIRIWKVKNKDGEHDCFAWRNIGEPNGYCSECGRKIPLYKLRMWLLRNFDIKYVNL